MIYTVLVAVLSVVGGALAIVGGFFVASKMAPLKKVTVSRPKAAQVSVTLGDDTLMSAGVRSANVQSFETHAEVSMSEARLGA
jgi:hypothetical protein